MKQIMAINRRQFLMTGAAMGLMPQTFSSLGAAAAPEKTPFKVLWNDDTTNIPKWTPGEVFQDDQLRGAINSVADKGIDAYMLSPGLGWIPWWKSKVYPDHYRWRLEKFGVKPDCFGKYLLAGGDLVRTLIDHCRKRKLAPFVSYRLNDNHHQEQRNSVWVSRFYEEHPEYLLNPKHYEKQGYSKERGQNWAIPAVREYKLALIRELCENYDFDGLELDFLRDDTLFRQNETTEEQRVTWVTEFVQAVRTALDGGPNKSRRRHLCVRIPCEIAKHGNSGINIERFAKAGVDMFNLSNWYHTAQRTDLAKVRSLAPDTAVYLELHYVTANKMASGYNSNAFPKTSNEQFYTTAHLAYERGADGVSFFNMQYNKRTYAVLPRITQRAWLAEQPQYYFLGNVPYYRQVPVNLSPRKAQLFALDMAPPQSFPKKKIRLRIHAETSLVNTLFEATLNGRRLEPCNDVSAFFNNPYDDMISKVSERQAFQANGIALENGINELTLKLLSEDKVRVTCVEAMVERDS
jgi:hypothetical protein